MEEAIAGRNTTAKALEEADLSRTNAVKALEEANLALAKLERTQGPVARDATLADVNRCLVEAEARASKAEEERGQAFSTLDEAISMNANLTHDRAWIPKFGVANAILHALETTNAVADVVERARDAGYMAGYTECLTHVNVVSEKKFTDEQCSLRAVDTEAVMKAAIDAYVALVVPALAQVEECLVADDYVDRLRALFEPKEDAEGENEDESED
ncbi:hypothetical protein HanXRQr2_Chr03g0096491 [Helianthus annuus]|uniref:Uncharacterized protein n=1 Tax=Helianthus annuus TaxID=4232 RepID=A0A9K3JD29_HELAN|nr:hypothetical protein HanXRQr2_Chr03g0096491 [Helianthus annuus]KAJ0599476.1 hypothetical protein HanIR_Chr03g0105311 [Helianthus annuus]KAJ0607043.1 hypothetical protein HanHA89_Chr03g0091971 [Helianthus annuus]KAJ0772954.1 hypothetical protein HanOQP8_Chr03g0093351 [Helianthus annuus]KAJ0942528.1 hypothetical protein HanPSC8_Chr03g0093031 [Helianthus annuus]